MGAVYQAWDAELGMAVALKVVRLDRATGAESERLFKQELVLARQVTHKNVIRIHDLGDVDGTKYFTMPYVDGADLASLIRQGRLPIGRGLQFARQMAAGLTAAHEAGVVHRDLKPANILIGGDTALITDFGIAHSLAGTSEGFGGIVGTIRYMAPEQAQGQPVDHRADIYAFGLILWEMLTGRGWTTGTNTVEVLHQKIEARVAAVNLVEGELPDAVTAIVRRCVQHEPADRYPSTAGLLADLEDLDDAGQPLPRARTYDIPRFVPFVGGKTIARGTALSVAAMCVAVPIASALAFFGGSLLPDPIPPLEHEPVPVLVADFDNQTGQQVFDGVIEQALGVALEGAPFITAYPRVDAQRLAFQIAKSDRLDLERSRLLAQREGIKVVLTGSIVAEGSRYRLTVNAIDPAPGTMLGTVTGTAANQDEVFGVVGELGSDLRTVLGDTTPESARLSDRETFTAASVEAASVYSQAQESLNDGKYEDSIPQFRRATEMDPSFARAYANWAIAEFYLGRRPESEALYKKAFALSDRMTEREKYRTYGGYYLLVAQAYDQAIENYEKLVQLYPADRAGHGNLAVAYFYRLNFAKTFEEGRRALELFPASLKLRTNYALYAMYTGDFATAAGEAEQVIEADPAYYQAYVPLAMASVSQSAFDAARDVYRRMSAIGGPAASRAAMGLADVELYQGRAAAAIETLEPAIAADDASGNRTGMAAKYIALADAHRDEERTREAIAAVGRALNITRHESVLLSAASRYAALGRQPEAARLVAELDTTIGGYGRSYARLLEGEFALRRNNPAEAVEHFLAGQKMADLWLFHFWLGQAYVQAGRYPEALAELEMCLKRRGEATALFLDDVPTYRYLAQLPYWLARAQEGVGVATQATENYRQFLALRQTLTRDPLVIDSQARLKKLGA
jgi:serine/threonine-protein kinase